MYLLLDKLFTTKWNEAIPNSILWAMTGVAHGMVTIADKMKAKKQSDFVPYV